MVDGDAFGREIVAQVREFVDARETVLRREMQTLRDRIAELEEAATRPDHRP